jgi:hypothetical protein
MAQPRAWFLASHRAKIACLVQCASHARRLPKGESCRKLLQREANIRQIIYLHSLVLISKLFEVVGKDEYSLRTIGRFSSQRNRTQR